MSDELVTIANFENIMDAEIARGRLESEGIFSFVQGGNMNLIASYILEGVRLNVRRSDALKAMEILGIEHAAGEKTDWGACPRCGSRELEPQKVYSKSSLISIIAMLPLLFSRTKFLCKACGESIQKPKT